MVVSHSAASDPNFAIWSRFQKALENQRIPQPYWRWYVLRAEQYLKASSNKPLDQHTADEVTTYLRKIGRTSRLKDWQYRQVVEALERIGVKRGIRNRGQVS